MKTLIKTATPLRLHILKSIINDYPTTDALKDAIERWEDEQSEEVFSFRPDWAEMAKEFSSYNSFNLHKTTDYEDEEIADTLELLDGMVFTEINILYNFFDELGDDLATDYDYLKSQLKTLNADTKPNTNN